MNKPEEYKYVAAWGRMWGSDRSYIRAQQERAAKDNAPIDAIYYTKGEGWSYWSEVKNPDTIWYFKINFPELLTEEQKQEAPHGDRS